MYYRFQLIVELNKMVEQYGYDYKFRMLKSTLEVLENNANSYLIFELIKTLNSVNKLFLHDVWKENEFKPINEKNVIDEVFNGYLEFLSRYTFYIGDISKVFKDQCRKDAEKKLFEHWNRAITGYTDNEKPFIEIFDDMHINAILKHPDTFTLKLGSMKNLYRAQRGQHWNNYKRMIPSTEHAKNKNRWNPEGVAFQYLGYAERVLQYDDTLNLIEKGCCEEIRLTPGQYVTTCRFGETNKNGSIINLCYEDVDYDSQELGFNKYIEQISQREARRILNKRSYVEQLSPFEYKEDIEAQIGEIIRKEVNKDGKKESFKRLAEIYVAKLIMKTIDEAVFLPVDKEDDPEFKAYIPFHHLSEYLQSKGYIGILYRSTRMNKIGLKGKNLVLFNPKDADPIEGSMNVYYYDGTNYHKVEKEIGE